MVERTHIGRVILLCTLVFTTSLYSEEKHEEKKDADRGELATEFGSELTDEEILSEAAEPAMNPTGSKGVVDSNLAELGDELKSDPSLTGSDEVLFNPPEYRVLEREGEIELKTPYGDYLVRGKFGPKGLAHYKFAVPLEAIKPPEKVEDEDEDLKEEEKPEEKEVPRQMASVGPVGNTDIMIVEANRLFNRKRYYEALTVVESILRQDPNYVRGWVMKGSLLHVQGHKELAKKAWNHALTLKPGDPEIMGILQRYR